MDRRIDNLKRQLAKRGGAFEALDSGIESCADPHLLQKLSDGLTAKKTIAVAQMTAPLTRQ